MLDKKHYNDHRVAAHVHALNACTSFVLPMRPEFSCNNQPPKVHFVGKERGDTGDRSFTSPSQLVAHVDSVYEYGTHSLNVGRKQRREGIGRVLACTTCFRIQIASNK